MFGADRVGPSATDADVDAIQQVMIDTGAVGKIADEIERLLEEALQAIDALPDVNGSRAALGPWPTSSSIATPDRSVVDAARERVAVA